MGDTLHVETTEHISIIYKFYVMNLWFVKQIVNEIFEHRF